LVAVVGAAAFRAAGSVAAEAAVGENGSDWRIASGEWSNGSDWRQAISDW
jgi:hypothetical protein